MLYISARLRMHAVLTSPPTFVTSARRDMVLVENQSVKLIELTVPHNSQESMRKAKVLKSSKEKYQKVLSDFDVKGLSAELYTIEIGSLGQWLPSSRKALLKAFPGITQKSLQPPFLAQPGKVVSASQIIFYARTELGMVVLPFTFIDLFIPVICILLFFSCILRPCQAHIFYFL